MKTLSKIFFILLSLFSFYCSEENPIIPPKQKPYVIDSSIFNWRFVEFHNFTVDELYVIDTNKIFICANDGGVFYNGTSFNRLFYSTNDFTPWCVAGTDENNVYFGGDSFLNEHPQLRKWNGGALEVINIPEDSTQVIGDIYINSGNEVWMTAYESNRVYKLVGDSITTYTLNSTNVRGGFFYKDYSGNLNLVGQYSFGTNSGYMYIYSFRNGEWVELRRDTITNGEGIASRGFGFCLNEIIAIGNKDMYSFNGSSWDFVANYPEYEFPRLLVSSIGGFNKDRFLTSATKLNPYGGVFLYFWDNDKWLLQSNYNPPHPVKDSYASSILFNNTFIIYYTLPNFYNTYYFAFGNFINKK